MITYYGVYITKKQVNKLRQRRVNKNLTRDIVLFFSRLFLTIASHIAILALVLKYTPDEFPEEFRVIALVLIITFVIIIDIVIVMKTGMVKDNKVCTKASPIVKAARWNRKSQV